VVQLRGFRVTHAGAGKVLVHLFARQGLDVARRVVAVTVMLRALHGHFSDHPGFEVPRHQAGVEELARLRELPADRS
jgi:hypothetical protein